MAYVLFSLGVLAAFLITGLLNMPVQIEADLD